MCGIAKTVNTDPRRLACFTVRAIAEHAGTKKRRNLDIAVFVRQTETKSRVDDGELGVTPIDGIAGEFCAIAKVLAVGSAISAFTIRPAEPRNAETFAKGKSLNAFADFFDAANDLVPGNKRQFRIGQFSIDQMQIGAANRARLNADEQLSGLRFRFRNVA